MVKRTMPFLAFKKDQMLNIILEEDQTLSIILSICTNYAQFLTVIAARKKVNIFIIL